jgi:hypothetical protein
MQVSDSMRKITVVVTCWYGWSGKYTLTPWPATKQKGLENYIITSSTASTFVVLSCIQDCSDHKSLDFQRWKNATVKKFHIILHRQFAFVLIKEKSSRMHLKVYEIKLVYKHKVSNHMQYARHYETMTHYVSMCQSEQRQQTLTLTKFGRSTQKS